MMYPTHPTHPYERICAKARVTPTGVRDRFGGQPFQGARWVLDRWEHHDPATARGYKLIRLAALIEDYEKRALVPASRD